MSSSLQFRRGCLSWCRTARYLMLRWCLSSESSTTSVVPRSSMHGLDGMDWPCLDSLSVSVAIFLHLGDEWSHRWHGSRRSWTVEEIAIMAMVY